MPAATEVSVPDLGDFADVPVIEIHVASRKPGNVWRTARRYRPASVSRNPAASCCRTAVFHW